MEITKDALRLEIETRLKRLHSEHMFEVSVAHTEAIRSWRYSNTQQRPHIPGAGFTHMVVIRALPPEKKTFALAYVHADSPTLDEIISEKKRITGEDFGGIVCEDFPSDANVIRSLVADSFMAGVHQKYVKELEGVAAKYVDYAESLTEDHFGTNRTVEFEFEHDTFEVPTDGHSYYKGHLVPGPIQYIRVGLCGGMLTYSPDDGSVELETNLDADDVILAIQFCQDLYDKLEEPDFLLD